MGRGGAAGVPNPRAPGTRQAGAVPGGSMAREGEAGLHQVNLRWAAGEGGRRRRTAGVEGVGWAARGMQPLGMG
jgi:hypothetical protein